MKASVPHHKPTSGRYLGRNSRLAEELAPRSGQERVIQMVGRRGLSLQVGRSQELSGCFVLLCSIACMSLCFFWLEAGCQVPFEIAIRVQTYSGPLFCPSMPAQSCWRLKMLPVRWSPLHVQPHFHRRLMLLEWECCLQTPLPCIQ